MNVGDAFFNYANAELKVDDTFTTDNCMLKLLGMITP